MKRAPVSFAVNATNQPAKTGGEVETIITSYRCLTIPCQNIANPRHRVFRMRTKGLPASDGRFKRTILAPSSICFFGCFLFSTSLLYEGWDDNTSTSCPSLTHYCT